MFTLMFSISNVALKLASEYSLHRVSCPYATLQFHRTSDTHVGPAGGSVNHARFHSASLGVSAEHIKAASPLATAPPDSHGPFIQIYPRISLTLISRLIGQGRAAVIGSTGSRKFGSLPGAFPVDSIP